MKTDFLYTTILLLQSQLIVHITQILSVNNEPGLIEILKIFDWESAPNNLQLVICTTDPTDMRQVSNEFIHTMPLLHSHILGKHEQENWPLRLKIGELSTLLIFLPKNSDEFYSIFIRVQQYLSQLEVKTRSSPLIFVWPLNEPFPPINPDGKLSPCHFTSLQNSSNDLDSTLELTIDVDLYFLFTKEGEDRRRRKFSFYEIYSIKNLDYFQQIYFPNELVDLNTLAQKLGRRTQFNKTLMTAVAQNDPVLAQYEVHFSKDLEFDSGLAVEIYWNLRDMLNFTGAAKVGSSLTIRNNTPSGISYEALVKYRTADLSLSLATITPIRAKFLAFLQPTMYGNGVNVFFKQPPLNKMRNIFVAPFDSRLWLTMICTWTVIILTMILFSWLSTKLSSNNGNNNNNRNDEGSEVDASFQFDALMWAIGAMCQKGWPRCPTRESMRIVFFCGCLSGVVTYLAYSAAIVSVLSVKHVPIKKFSDLIPYNFLFYVHELSGTLRDFLRTDLIENPKYNLTQDILTVNTENEVNIMLTGPNGFLSFPDVFYPAAVSLGYDDTRICDTFTNFPVNSYRGGGSSMFLRQGSSIIETFNHKIIMMKERGLNTRYIQEYNDKTQAHCAPPSVKTLPLANSDLLIAFLIVIVGLAVSFTIFVLEKSLVVLTGRMMTSSSDALVIYTRQRS